MQPLIDSICNNTATTSQRLIYADWLEERGATVRPRLIRTIIQAEAAAAKATHWQPEPRPVNDGWAWWNRDEFNGDNASHLPREVFVSLMGGRRGELGRYFDVRHQAVISLRAAVIAAWLHGWRPAAEDLPPGSEDTGP